MPADKSSLGVVPREFHTWCRIEDLSRAIQKYIEKGPFDADCEYHAVSVWVKELGELLAQGRGAKELGGFPSRNTLSLKEVDCNTTTEFMVLTMRALRQIYYLLYEPDGQPDKPEALLLTLGKFEEKLKEVLEK